MSKFRFHFILFLSLFFIPFSACKQEKSEKVDSPQPEKPAFLEHPCPEGTQKVENLNKPFAEIYCMGPNGREGLWRQYDKMHHLYLEGHYQNDKQVGTWTRFHENGQPMTQGELVDGRREGLWTDWYVDGAKRSEKMFVHSQVHGTTRLWYRSGQLMAEGESVDNVEQGLWKVWNEKGELARECTMIDGNETNCVNHIKDAPQIVPAIRGRVHVRGQEDAPPPEMPDSNSVPPFEVL